MSLSAHEITWLLDELAPLAASGRVRNVHNDGQFDDQLGKVERDIVLTVRVPGENLFLRISAHPEASRLALLPERPKAPPKPTGFVELLRKRLRGTELMKLEQVPDDRIVYLRFGHFYREQEDREKEDREQEDQEQEEKTGKHQQYVLACELTGQSANLLLLDLEDAELDADVRGARVLGALDPSLHKSREYEPRPPLPPGHRSGSVRLQLRSHVQEIAGDSEPSARDMSRAIEELYWSELRELARDQRWHRLNRAVKREHKRAKRLSKALEGDLERAENSQEYKEYGDILAANFNAIEKGLDEITLDNFYDDMKPITISLDPARSPRANVDRYYRRYKKYRDAVDDIETRYTETLLRLDELAALRQDVREAKGDDDPIRALEQRAKKLDISLQPPKQRQTRKRKEARLPYRSFRSATGKPIYVGKGSKDNDALTFRVANGNDLWLHAAGVPGSHVIVKLNRGKSVDSDTLLDAATLAAHYSRASTGNIIEVHYTRQKHVRKVKGAAPGLVTMAGAKTIAVRIEDDRLERLKGSADA